MRTSATGGFGATMSCRALVPSMLVVQRVDEPERVRAIWSATATTPAISGDDRLVPPMRYWSQYVPSGKTWVSPTSNPVFGSPGIAMSGTARIGVLP